MLYALLSALSPVDCTLIVSADFREVLTTLACTLESEKNCVIAQGLRRWARSCAKVQLDEYAHSLLYCLCIIKSSHAL